MDGTDGKSVRDAVRSSCCQFEGKPVDVVVNCMAIASPEACQKNQELARTLNVPTTLLEAMKEHCPNALLVQLSTDMVYVHPMGWIARCHTLRLWLWLLVFCENLCFG